MIDPVATSLAFGRGVTVVRKSRGISQLALSEECGLPASTLSHIECEKGGVTLTTAIIISRQLGVGIDKLIEIGEKTPLKKDAPAGEATPTSAENQIHGEYIMPKRRLQPEKGRKNG